MQIAEFVASLKIKTDNQSLRKVDQFLRIVEKKIKKSSGKLDIFGVALNQRKVNSDIQRVLNNASRTATLRIHNFRFNTARLKQSLDSILRNNTTPLVINNFRINRESLRRNLTAAAQSISIPVNIGGVRQPNNARPSQNRMTGGGAGGRSGSRFSITPRGVGVAAGGVGIFGGLGIAALNRSVRELENLPVALQAVTGSSERTAAELSFLNDLGNEVGAPVRTLAPEYTKFLSSALGTPLENSAQSSYRNILRYSKVIGMDEQATKGTLKAITQIANKQRVYAEELVG